MRVSRVERPSLTGVAAIMGSSGNLPDTAAQVAANASTRDRHDARIGQQCALAQYVAQQQYVERQRRLHPDGDLPDVRTYARTEPEPQRSLEAQVRDLLAARGANQLTDADVVRRIAALVE